MLSLQQVSATDSNDEIKLHSMLDELGDVPQALFELSLRDLVELPQIIASAMQEKQSKEREFTERKSRSWEERKKTVKKRRPRSQSMDVGVGLLKWIIPLSSSRRKERFVFVSPSSLTSGTSTGARGESREAGQGGGESTRNTSADSSRSISNLVDMNKVEDVRHYQRGGREIPEFQWISQLAQGSTVSGVLHRRQAIHPKQAAQP
ncbi:hypothetical protein ZIOFF_010884 [Zingiber officinale]|uniref:Uncharacterized protein n=1 Tax=Zingiber officinale TaxID=94328 RepID=A0A8J5I733_ZINOF|nr:hypothetical protein ZIOFF_010884 [Zingiber officinale]